jgi:hypothetical protein
MEIVIESLNIQRPESKLDPTTIKFPKISQGYLGPQIPHFPAIPPRMKNANNTNNNAAFSLSALSVPAAPAVVSPSPVAENKSPVVVPLNPVTPSAADGPPETKVNHTAPPSHTVQSPPVVTTFPSIIPEKAATDSTTQATTAEQPAQSSQHQWKHEEIGVTEQPQPQLSDEEEPPYQMIAPLSAPPKMLGWLRKRGHIVQSWKTRYMVLDNGFLSYYVDKSDTPPYGKNMKGQICLAGFREVALLQENGKLDENKVKAFQSDRQSFIHESDTKLQQGSGGKRRASSMFTSEPMLRIHLKYVAGLLDEQVVEDIRLTVSKNNKEKGSADKQEVSYEFMMEASSLEEKYAWLAAIEAHTNYIESVAQSGNYMQMFPPVDDENDDNNKNSTTNSIAKNPSSASLANSPSNTDLSAVPNNNNISNNEIRNSPTVTESSNDKARMISTANNGARRVSVANVSSAANQKWKIFLKRDEELICNGLTGKPNPFGVQLIRELILVASRSENTKRLVYIDANSFELKGDIIWSSKDTRYPTVKKVKWRFPFSFKNLFHLFFYF